MTPAPRLALCERGSVAVEFAMILPILLTLMLGVMEFGRAMWIRQTLQYAVESAARTALADSTLGGSSIMADVKNSLPGLTGLAPTVTVTATATQINVKADYAFSFLVPGLLPFGPLVISAQSNTPR